MFVFRVTFIFRFAVIIMIFVHTLLSAGEIRRSSVNERMAWLAVGLIVTVVEWFLQLVGAEKQKQKFSGYAFR